MKKTLIAFFICLLTINTASAQDQTGIFSLSGNISYGTKIESLGVGLRAQYGFIDRFRGVLEYKYYIDRHNWSAWGITADAHYVLGITNSNFAFYPIAGVTLSRWTNDTGRADIPNIDRYKESFSRLGLNLGLGFQIGLSENTFLQIEAKEALIKKFSQFVISAGFMYQF